MKFCDSYTLSGNYATIEFQSEGWEKWRVSQYSQSNLSEDNLNSNQVLLTKRTVVNKPTISYPCDFKMI
jgi:hypothetical protein